ncbi:hypothetical protein [Psychrobacter sp. ANT_WB68]|uniref:hypothetical protein n=1 Tax=Psychrobacter sp. ANT_WB68 TaxID=2597355 RepID=UPI0011F391DF|nr:hypothetical protein [Psychrobacter sp. ANT_WB68]KAA0915929.1 hypothetical protein FQ084_05200 [Psychrobacter sp. ANT_WB68]
MKARNYKLEIKERAIRMLIEAANNYPLHGQPSKSSVAKGFCPLLATMASKKGGASKSMLIKNLNKY